MFSHKLTEETKLRLLEERHAKELTDLTDRNREHLRAWLPWVDADRTLEDRKDFIRGALQQFAHNKGFAAGIWHEGRLAGVIGYDPIDWENGTTELGYWLGERGWPLPHPDRTPRNPRSLPTVLQARPKSEPPRPSPMLPGSPPTVRAKA